MNEIKYEFKNGTHVYEISVFGGEKFGDDKPFIVEFTPEPYDPDTCLNTEEEYERLCEAERNNMIRFITYLQWCIVNHNHACTANDIKSMIKAIENAIQQL